MYMSTHYLQNIVPKKCAFNYAELCTTTCNNVNDFSENYYVSVCYMKLCVDRDLNCG